VADDRLQRGLDRLARYPQSFERDDPPGVHTGWYPWYYPDGFTDSGIVLDEARVHAGVDCRRRRISVESVLWMNRGRVVREVSGDRAWGSPEPESIPEFVLEAVCAWTTRTPAG
jgi:hypothetical protein